MKYTTTKPRKLASGKRAPYYGVRIQTESAYEDQALSQLFPNMGKAPKGRETEAGTRVWMDQVRQAVERRAHFLAMGMPVQDTKEISVRLPEYIEWGKLHGGKRNHGWGEGHDRHQRDHIQHFVDVLGLKSISDVRQGPFDLEIARLAKRFAPNTVNHYGYALSGFCTWAVRAGYLPASPIAFRSLEKSPKAPRGSFTLDELRKLFQGVPWARGLVYRAAYLLRFRRRELASLRVSSMLWASALVKLAAKDAKDRKDAVKTVPAALLQDLWESSQGKDPSAPLLDFGIRHAAEVLHRDMERLEIPLMSHGKKRDFHSFGHSTATSMDRHGVGPALASRYMRHKTWAQTQDYVNTEVEEERVISQGLENELLHTGDAQEARMRSESITTGLSGHRAGSPSPSANNSIPFPTPGKSPKFRQLSRDKRKVPAVTWAKAQDILAHCTRMLLQGGAADLAAFLKLSPAQRAAALAQAKKAAG
jgi:site-specific recombinase XerD